MDRKIILVPVIWRKEVTIVQSQIALKFVKNQTSSKLSLQDWVGSLGFTPSEYV